ncbi:MAG TPA: Re/Si-specific NAD(P)(+) transhydrogenase subunit alpha [Pirellulaceae bacterium]|nr:Re/Si-specific NAD(P)(+) transhydrogenase subunit alpha [Pirellulaceae bacterium]HMO92904.1 Re/Si-specific NAD(P)(+) transhydrogenase subunit alpha [Pirellulaceae bacterium]HMP69182.1 Re/Si-specific NAD(P)(+) transhydrogenase subunit alpha [Pirellulaceae bacterium]
MIIGIPKEIALNERRVAATPDSVRKLIKLGYEVIVQSGSGELASFTDDSFRNAGASIETDPLQLLSRASVVLKVLPPTLAEVASMRRSTLLISFIWPAKDPELLQALSRQNVHTLAMDCVPRISRAQKLDALSSMANIAGYRAVIEAANHFGSFFTGQITAAGKVPPAKVLVIGAGVAGLAAIGTASSLGAVVRAFDTRPAVKDQVKSMGGEFLELEFEESGEGAGGYAKTMSPEFIKAEMELFARQAKEVDIIVTTALIPGKTAPTLITAEMVRSMKPGSVIVDLAAEQGGNCELTKPGEVVREHDVTLIGFTDLPSRLPTQSSTLCANNLVNFLSDLTPNKDGQFHLNLHDEIVHGSLVVHEGEVRWPPKPFEQAEAKVVPESKPVAVDREAALAEVAMRNARRRRYWMIAGLLFGVATMLVIGLFFPPTFVAHFTVFVLACFVGWQVVWNVTPALHTPLMSVTNAISGIIIIGALFKIGTSILPSVLALVAILLASINVSGGFLVTQRMLGMFRKD